LSLVEAWTGGARTGVFEAEKFSADVTKTPIPRFELLKPHHYRYVGVQFSRGCPSLVKLGLRGIERVKAEQ
jgi:hypothetical protein